MSASRRSMTSRIDAFSTSGARTRRRDSVESVERANMCAVHGWTLTASRMITLYGATNESPPATRLRGGAHTKYLNRYPVACGRRPSKARDSRQCVDCDVPGNMHRTTKPRWFAAHHDVHHRSENEPPSRDSRVPEAQPAHLKLLTSKYRTSLSTHGIKFVSHERILRT